MPLPPPLKSIVVNGKKKIAVNGVVNINASSKGGVQPDWNQNDATKPDYIKNRPFYETTTPLFPEATFKFNEQGSLPSIGFATDEPVLVDGDNLVFESSNPDILIKYAGGSFSPDGKSGSFGFSVYDLNGGNQGGGAGSLSYDEDSGKYIFAISGGGNPNVVANLEFTMTVAHYMKIDSNFLQISSPLRLNEGNLTVDSMYGGLFWSEVSPDFTVTVTDLFTLQIQKYYGLKQEGINTLSHFFQINWTFRVTDEDLVLPANSTTDILRFQYDSSKTETGLWSRLDSRVFHIPFRLGSLYVGPANIGSTHYVLVTYSPIIDDTWKAGNLGSFGISFFR